MSASGTEYIKDHSFEVPGDVSWASAGQQVAFLVDRSTVILLDAGRTEIVLENEASDIALGSRLYAIGDDSLEAYGLSGTRLWSIGIQRPRRVVAPATEDLVIVQTGDDRYLAFDGPTSQERFAIDRPHADVTNNPGLVCVADGLVISAWSFLTVIDYNGDVVDEYTVDGAIDGHGVVDSTILTATKDGRFVGIDLETGELAWTKDWPVNGLGRSARGEYVLRGDGDLVSVTPSGEDRTIALSDGQPIAAGSGEPLCLLKDGIISVYRGGERSVEHVEGELLDEALSPADRFVAFELSNGGDSGVVLDLELEPSGFTTPEPLKTVTISPGVTERIRFPIGALDNTNASVCLHANDDTLVEADIGVDYTVGELSCSTAVTEISPDEMTVALSISNGNPTPVDSLAIRPVDVDVPRIDPGEVVTVDITCTADTELTIHGDDTTAIELGLPVATDPLTAVAEGTDEGIEVTVHNETDALVHDTVTASGDALVQDIEQSVELSPNSSVTLHGDVTRTGELSVVLTGTFLDESATVQLPADAEPIHAESESESGAGEPEDNEADQATDSINLDEAPPRPSPRLELLRVNHELDPVQPAPGQAITERIKVQNRGTSPAEVAIGPTYGNDTVSISVGPGKTEAVERFHALFDTPGKIPSTTVTIDDAVHRTADRLLELVPPELDARGLLVRDGDTDARMALDLLAGQTSVRLLDIGSRHADLTTEGLPVTIDPETTVQLDVSVEGYEGPDGALPIRIKYRVGGAAEEIEALAYEVQDTDLGLSMLDLSVTDETSFGDSEGTIVVSIVNKGAAVEDVVIEADAACLRDILYDRDEVDRLRPGEHRDHLIDVRTPEEALDITIGVSGTIEGSAVSTTARLVGTPPDSLRIEHDEGSSFDPSSFEYPARFSTGFGVHEGADPTRR